MDTGTEKIIQLLDIICNHTLDMYSLTISFYEVLFLDLFSESYLQGDFEN